jgi:hypothetical protein
MSQKVLKYMCAMYKVRLPVCYCVLDGFRANGVKPIGEITILTPVGPFNLPPLLLSSVASHHTAHALPPELASPLLPAPPSLAAADAHDSTRTPGGQVHLHPSTSAPPEARSGAGQGSPACHGLLHLPRSRRPVRRTSRSWWQTTMLRRPRHRRRQLRRRLGSPPARPLAWPRAAGLRTRRAPYLASNRGPCPLALPRPPA